MKKLNTPGKVQDFLNSIPYNFEKNGETLKSPILTLRTRRAHCFEGALLGAYLLSRYALPGSKPQILYLKATKHDQDHVIAPFRQNGLWGALSKTNHAVLRYREPVYRNIRELVMSYFHEYFLNNGQKTLRQYSGLLNLNTFEDDWVTSPLDLWGIDQELNRLKHYGVLPKNQKNFAKNLRKADKVEIKAGKVTEWRK